MEIWLQSYCFHFSQCAPYKCQKVHALLAFECQSIGGFLIDPPDTVAQGSWRLKRLNLERSFSSQSCVLMRLVMMAGVKVTPLEFRCRHGILVPTLKSWCRQLNTSIWCRQKILVRDNSILVPPLKSWCRQPSFVGQISIFWYRLSYYDAASQIVAFWYR